MEFDKWTVFLWIGILMLPNVLFQFFPLCMRRNAAPTMSFIYSILLNVSYGLFIGYISNKYLLIPAIVVVVVSWLMILIPCSYCCCRTSFEGNNFIVREIFGKQRLGIEFTDKLARNRAYPPTIRVNATAYHYETRIEYYTTTDSNGHSHQESRTVREEVDTWHGSKNLKYGSWEEDGNSIRIGQHKILHAVTICKIKPDDSAKKGTEKLINHMRNEALYHDRYAKVKTEFFVNGINDSITGTTLSDIPFIMSFYQSWFGRALWFFFLIIGYQSAYEAIWSSAGERVRLKLKKKVSMKEDKYRCKFDKEDKYAIETTFKNDDGTQYQPGYPLIQGGFDSYFTQYPSVNAIDVYQMNQQMPPQNMQQSYEPGYPPNQQMPPGYPPNQQMPPGYPPNQMPPGYPPNQMPPPGYAPNQQLPPGYQQPPPGYPMQPPPGYAMQPPPGTQPYVYPNGQVYPNQNVPGNMPMQPGYMPNNSNPNNVVNREVELEDIDNDVE